MSHVPRAIATVGHAIMTAGLPMNTGIASTNMALDHIPLSERAADELLARAAELRLMAETATTADVMQALLTLADRYVALAEKRLVQDGRSIR